MSRYNPRHTLIFAAISALLMMPAAQAQHGIDVERLSANGEHLKALVTYDTLAKRSMSTRARAAAAKSAWALGLTDRARGAFQAILEQPDLPATDRARIYLMLSLIEFQAMNYPIAALHAERGMSLAEADPVLQAKIQLVWGQSLSATRQWGQARATFERALTTASKADAIELHYQLGATERVLGNQAAARQHLEQIPLAHERTAAALRMLAEMALEDKQYTQARLWLERARADYPQEFLDSWVDYALVLGRIQERNTQAMRILREEAGKRFPPSDGWLVLLNAAAERYEWELLSGSIRAQLKAPAKGGT